MDEELNSILTNEELDNTAKVEAVKKFVGTKYVPQERYNTLKDKSTQEVEQIKAEFDAYKTSKMTDEEKQLAEAQAKEEELKNANRTISKLYAENIFKGAGLQEADYAGIIDNIQDLPQEKVKELASSFVNVITAQKESATAQVKQSLIKNTPTPSVSGGSTTPQDTVEEIQMKLDEAKKSGNTALQAHYIKELQSQLQKNNL